MRFAFAALVFMYFGRRFGWFLSKSILYRAPTVIMLMGVTAWGVIVGWCMGSLIHWQHPNVVSRWILGFALAAYVAIPNYGLFDEATVPDSAQLRHVMTTFIPLATYVVTEFVTASIR